MTTPTNSQLADINAALAHHFHQVAEQIKHKATEYNDDILIAMLANDQASLLTPLIDHLIKAGIHYENELSQLVQIDASFSNVETGSYGICSDCECHIDLKLLTETPYRQRCSACLDKYLAAPEAFTL